VGRGILDARRQSFVRNKFGGYPQGKGVKVAHRSLRWSYFWTSLASNPYFWTNFASRGRQSRGFGPVSTSVKRCFCGQTLPPATDKVWEKSQNLSLFPSFIRRGQTLLPIAPGQTMLPVPPVGTVHLPLPLAPGQVHGTCPELCRASPGFSRLAVSAVRDPGFLN
jgi:hypothetical protein